MGLRETVGGRTAPRARKKPAIGQKKNGRAEERGGRGRGKPFHRRGIIYRVGNLSSGGVEERRSGRNAGMI